jgi:hypothetical protein
LSKSDAVEKSAPQALERYQSRPVTWDEIGDAFETMGKVGLAMAVGMSAAGLFCRLAQQGKIKVPTLSGMMVNRGEQPKSDKRRTASS